MTAFFRTALFLLLLLPLESFASPRHFNVTITLPPDTDTTRLFVFYDNGQKSIRIKPVLANNTCKLSGDFISRYATISIAWYRHPDEENPAGGSYWVNERAAVLDFSKGWEHPHLVNAYDVAQAGGLAYEAAIRKVKQEKDDYWNVHEKAILDLESPEREVFFGKMKAIEDKRLAFLSTHKTGYYPLWLFRTELVYIGATVPYGYKGHTVEELRKLFTSYFPDSVIQSAEGAEVLKILASRAVRKGAMAPDFSVSDISGNHVMLSNYKGKYVLLNFWASWCVPCVAELPAIRKIYETYDRHQLEVISISADRDSIAFIKAVDKFQIKWTKVYNKEQLCDDYGVTALPFLFLIDKEGKIIYERQEEVTTTIDSLPLLQQKLKSLLGQQQNTHPEHPF